MHKQQDYTLMQFPFLVLIDRMSMENFNFPHKFLSTFDGLGDDANTIGVAREEAAAIINVFAKSSLCHVIFSASLQLW